MTHETFANVRFAKLSSESYPTTNHDPRADTQIFHHSVMDGTRRIVEENIHAPGRRFLHGCRQISGFLIIDCHIESNLATPLKFVVVSRNSHGATPCQVYCVKSIQYTGTGYASLYQDRV